MMAMPHSSSASLATPSPTPSLAEPEYQHQHQQQPMASSSSPQTLSTSNVLRPRLTFAAAGGDKDVRIPSISFAAAAAHHHVVDSRHQSAAASLKPHPPQLNHRRMISPPPPSTYESRVSFDTFDNRDATDFAFTLVSKHKHYVYSARSRTFLCGTDQNDYSDFALEWLVDELVEDGDEIVCLRVVDKDSKINSDSALQEGKYKIEARKLLEHIQDKNKDDEKSISVILEFAVGKVPETIQRMISIYSPACLIVGTRGRSLGGIQGLLPGSVSKYCLQNSPVPVVVVRPSAKREKKKRKRLQNPARRVYQNIFEKSGVNIGHMFDKNERDKMVPQSGGEASEVEAQAVADAIGLNEKIGIFANFRKEVTQDHDGHPLAKVASVKSDSTYAESPSPTGSLGSEDTEGPDLKNTEFERLDADQELEEEGAEEDVEEEEAEEAEEEEAEEEAEEDEDGADELKDRRRVEKTAIEAARKMEAGEGKYLKSESRIEDDA